MTREEQINKAAFDYADTLEIGENRFDYEDIEFAFQSGAEWADENPKPGLIDLPQVWHNVSERPKHKAWFIAQIGEKCFDTFIMEMDKNDTWANWSKGINITRWAYIEDLLPKGGDQ